MVSFLHSSTDRQAEQFYPATLSSFSLFLNYPDKPDQCRVRVSCAEERKDRSSCTVWIISLISTGLRKQTCMLRWREMVCPIWLTRATGSPLFKSHKYGERTPSHRRPEPEQTLGTFEQGESPVNDLWIQGVSHLPRGAARPLPVPPYTPNTHPLPLPLPPAGILEAPDPLQGMLNGLYNVSNKETTSL